MEDHCFFLFFFSLLLSLPLTAISKSTIEPCSGSDSCPALLGYTLYTDLKVSEVAALFNADPAALLAANSIDPAAPAAADRILPDGLFLRVPTPCSCSDGIRKSVAVRYSVRPADTLDSVAGVVFAGLASPDQIAEANSISGADALDVGKNLIIPLPCTCFNNTDSNLPAIFLSYVVRSGDTVPGIAAEYSTTVTDIMNVNAMGSPVIQPGDIIAVPLAACDSMFPQYASDYGLVVAYGSYAETASDCVQCSCGPGNRNLYCTPAPLAVSCSSMQCSNSNLMLGNVTSQHTSAGCNVTSCNYGGFVNGTIITQLVTSLQPQCPGPMQVPPLMPPPSTLPNDSFPAPSIAPEPSEAGGPVTTPKTTIPGQFSLPGVTPANGPSGSISEASFVNPSYHIFDVFVCWLVLNLLL